MVRFQVGLDLGQRQDHSAMVVVEDAAVDTGTKDRVTYAPVVERRRTVRYVERVALGTEYAKVVERVRWLVGNGELRQAEVVVAADATGVGAAVVEALRKALYQGQTQRSGAGFVDLVPVVFTGGAKGKWSGRYYFAPKNELMDRLTLAFERGEVKMARGKRGMEELREELKGMKREPGMRWRTVGKHDDLVMALALAVWGLDYRPVPENWEGLGWGGGLYTG